MLGRSANAIFWMFRYLERAENLARLIDTGFRMALTRDHLTAEEEWRSVIETAGMRHAYQTQNGTYAGIQVWNYILRDRHNPNSIRSLIGQVRANARSARNSITTEVWEAVNESYLHLTDLLNRPVTQSGLADAINAVKRESTQVRGAMDGSMLRNDIYNFARIGAFLERADNTSRILDVKYYVLLPSLSYVGSSLDNVQWETILRSLGAERAYRWLNAGQLDARGIADFLILDGRFPRSLRFCYAQMRANLHELALQYGGELRSHEVMRNADLKLQDRDIDLVIDMGLHEFLSDFISTNNEIAHAIQTDYRFTD
ncbi:alpha-E domain-containing protein [Croceicoccus ponticola]|uniref:Alpha-E domain-containing protein n=1 Tax=Croceicoccus ponticola TaxID=2217664 RepID=A0A437GV66_9SPHN|nr:alpha-E domain-containing protein [Croceicoccus ponticola]RVQ65522.1 alpha-E domain-containing protein [Croceicoccus ponticola]